MSFADFLCNVGLHRWRDDVESMAKRYRHNTWWDKTKNHLGSPRALMQTCKCCGKKRKWSFNRGKWRDHHENDRDPSSNDAAWEAQPFDNSSKS